MNDAAAVTVRAATADQTPTGWPRCSPTRDTRPGASDLAARIDRFSAPESHVLVAEAGDEVIGFIAFHLLPTVRDGRAVRPDRRAGRGSGCPRARDRAPPDDRGRASSCTAEGAAFLEITAGHHRPDARKLFESLGYDAGVAAYLRKRP